MSATVHDPKGVWIKNTSIFNMPDPVNGLVYVGGEVTQVTLNDWIKSQPVLVPASGPDGELIVGGWDALSEGKGKKG